VSVTADLDVVIGLEVHAQLLTKSKMFCGCSAGYASSPPNTHVCAVCSGMPGSLPVINSKAVDYTIRTALALHCDVRQHSKFDRKNYPYPDIPKGFQISQYDKPIGEHGWLAYRLGEEILRCGIRRVHLEEDTGKTAHVTVGGREVSLVDYNRSGVPLMEIVTEPELQSPEAARQFFEALRQILMYLGVCDGKLQEGSMRADVNVSLRLPDGALGTKVEIKNLNSFRAVQRALEFEVDRQREVLLSGGALVQETRGWVEDREVTVSQRTKEYAHDYRYFPEPDLPPMVLAAERVRRLREAQPELPLAREQRLTEKYELPPDTARVLTDDRALADFYESALRSTPEVDPRVAANWVTGDLLRLINDSGMPIEAAPISPPALGRLLAMVQIETVGGPAAKQVLAEMYETGDEPEAIVERRNLQQIVDPPVLESLVRVVLAENPQLVDTYRRGKTNALMALVGKVMHASNRKAHPQRTQEILERSLNEPG